jgi:hypothetical protein
VAARDVIERFDQALGDGLERLVVAHHRRRLRNHGWLGALDAPAGGWAAGEPAPRAGNRFEVFVDGAVARAVRLRLWAEHLGCDAAELEGDPARMVDERWRPLAEEQLERRRRGERTTHRLLLLPHVSRRAKALLGPVNGFFVDG